MGELPSGWIDLEDYLEELRKGMATIEERHRLAARKYDKQYKPNYSWAPIWDGAKFVLHAWRSSSSVMAVAIDVETRRETVCTIKQSYPKTFVVSGDEPYCDKCQDVTLEPLAQAFADCEAQGGQK